MKKILLNVSMLTLMICLSAFLCLSASAKTVYEQENNDDYSSAQVIELGDSVIGRLNPSNDSDYYKVVAPADGKINLKFLHEYEEDGSGWAITVYKYTGSDYIEFYSTEIHLDYNENITLPYVGAIKNTTYYILVEGRAYYPATESYTLETSFIKSDYYEKEDNDSYKTATPITLNKTYNGILSASYDKDYYKIVAPSNGKIDIKFCHTYEDSGDGWSITVYRYSNGQYDELSNQGVWLNSNERVTIPYIGAVKGGIYYVKITERKYYPAVNHNYSLKVNFTKSDYYEKEVNDSYAQATQIVLNNSYGGILNSSSDCDYYRIKPIIDGKISVKFKHKYRDSGDGWTIRTFCYYDGGYSELSGDTVCLNSDESIDFSIYGAKKGRIYYIVVSERGWYPAIGENYTLDVRFDVPKPSSVSAKSSTSSISLSWKKVSGASGYEVQMKNGKTYKAVAATSKTNATVKKLKTGTKYTFRVRAYKVISGVKYYSGWTTFSAATAPAAPSLKATPGTKSATLKAGKQAATGFEIYRASSKNGKFKKIATVKGSSLSYKNKSLKSKSTYYYKVRAYVSVDGVKYYSAYSSVKSVKAK